VVEFQFYVQGMNWHLGQNPTLLNNETEPNNDRHQRMAGEEHPHQDANDRHSAAWLCSSKPLTRRVCMEADCRGKVWRLAMEYGHSFSGGASRMLCLFRLTESYDHGHSKEQPKPE
jgi:hypothetical protein